LFFLSWYAACNILQVWFPNDRWFWYCEWLDGIFILISHKCVTVTTYKEGDIWGLNYSKPLANLCFSHIFYVITYNKCVSVITNVVFVFGSVRCRCLICVLVFWALEYFVKFVASLVLLTCCIDWPSLVFYVISNWCVNCEIYRSALWLQIVHNFELSATGLNLGYLLL
jgi:hypothetical protein